MKNILKIALVLFFLLMSNSFAQYDEYNYNHKDSPIGIKVNVIYPKKHEKYNYYTSDDIVTIEYDIHIPAWPTGSDAAEFNRKKELEECGWEVLLGPDGKTYDLNKELKEKLVYKVRPKVKGIKTKSISLKIPNWIDYFCIIVDNYAKYKSKISFNECMKYNTRDESGALYINPGKPKPYHFNIGNLKINTSIPQYKNEAKGKYIFEHNYINSLTPSLMIEQARYKGKFYYKKNDSDLPLTNYKLVVLGRYSSTEKWKFIKEKEIYNSTDGEFDIEVNKLPQLFFVAFVQNKATIAIMPEDDWDGSSSTKIFPHALGITHSTIVGTKFDFGKILLDDDEFTKIVTYCNFKLQGFDYYLEKTGRELEQSWLLYHKNLSYGPYTTYSYENQKAIMVLPKFFVNEQQVILHEYAHIINLQVGSIGYNSGGKHYIYSRYNPELAFSEGFPTYFTCKILNTTIYNNINLDNSIFRNIYANKRHKSLLCPNGNYYEGFENELLTASFLLYIGSSSQKETDILNAIVTDVPGLGRKPITLLEFLEVVNNSSYYTGSSTRNVRKDLYLADGDIYFAQPSDNVQNIINNSPNGSLIYLTDGIYNQNMHFIDRHGALYGRAYHKVTVKNPNKSTVPNTVYFNSSQNQDVARVYGIKIMDGMTGIDASKQNPVFTSFCRFTNNDHGVCTYQDIWVNNSVFDLNIGSGVILPPNVSSNTTLKVNLINNIFIGGHNAISLSNEKA